MRIAFAISAAIVAGSASATDVPPFSANTVFGYTTEAASAEGLKRLKITLTSEQGKDQQVRLGAIVACSRTACFRAQTQGFVDLASTEDGKGATAVDAAVPVGEIDSLYFEPTAGAKILTGAVHLEKPLVLEKDFQGGEVLVVVARKPRNQYVEYVPVATTSLPFSPDWQVVYYNPKFTTKVSFDFGGELSIPAGATSKPQIFSILSRDIGQRYPSVDIFPQLKLEKPASITLKPMTHPDVGANPNSSYAIPTLAAKPARGAPDSSGVTDTTGIIRFELRETGPVVPGAKRNSSAKLYDDAAATADCVTTLSYPANQQAITNTLAQHPSTYLDWCTNISPNIWIGIANLADVRINYDVYTPSTTLAPYPWVGLEKITFYSAPGGVGLAINGFTWDGDSGTSDGQKGLDDGYLYSHGGKYGNNRIGGGVGSGTSSGNKLVMGNRGGNLGFAFYELSAVDAVYQDYTYNVISSSTSVVKWGNCSTDTLLSRWSAVGVNLGDPSGQPRLVMVSSTSGGTTTAATLCSIFTALHIVDAIRLDGGPSAVFSANGYPMNPLTGLYFLKYGSLRHIANAIRL